MTRAHGLALLLLALVGCEYSLSNCSDTLCVNASSGAEPLVDHCDLAAGCSRSCPAAERVDADTLREVALARRFYAQCRAVGAADLSGISLSPALDAAARTHAQDMAVNGFESALGSDGLSVFERVAAEASGGDAQQSALAQLVASGPRDAAQALDYWLQHPAHCAVLLSERFSHLGVACADGHRAQLNRWSLVLGGAGL